MTSSNPAASQPSDARFLTTQWNVVLATQDENPVQAHAALEALCRNYWYPIYAYIRKKGQSPHDAQDLTQGFFSRMLEKDYLGGVGKDKGKFRTFLLVALNRFLINDWVKNQTQKRGGGCVHVPIEIDDAENRYSNEFGHSLDAEKLYERRWALTLLERVIAQLRDEYMREGKTELFNRLKGSLMAGKGEIPHQEAAAALGMSAGAIKVAVYRLRQRFRKLFHEEVAKTVEAKEDIDSEIRHLLQSFNP